MTRVFIEMKFFLTNSKFFFEIFAAFRNRDCFIRKSLIHQKFKKQCKNMYIFQSVQTAMYKFDITYNKPILNYEKCYPITDLHIVMLNKMRTSSKCEWNK